MNMKRNVIWSNWELNLEDWKDYLEEEYPNADEDKQYEIMDELNDMYLDDERINLDIQLPEEIIILADLGLWYGRRYGYKIIESGNIADCLYSECDYATFYCDNYNFKADCIHHDGSNSYLYRTWKDGISETQKENFLNAIYNGKCNSKMITRYTKSLRPYIAKVYGW